MRYRISEDAERDLDEIFVYWADRAGLEVADRITDRITERFWLLGEHPNAGRPADHIDRKSTRLNSSHGYISYAVFCLKKKKHQVIAADRTGRSTPKFGKSPIPKRCTPGGSLRLPPTIFDPDTRLMLCTRKCYKLDRAS